MKKRKKTFTYEEIKNKVETLTSKELVDFVKKEILPSKKHPDKKPLKVVP